MEANLKVNLNFNSSEIGGDAVRAERVAEVLDDTPPAAEVGPYSEKCREGTGRIGFDPGGFARVYPGATRATPTRWQVW